MGQPKKKSTNICLKKHFFNSNTPDYDLMHNWYTLPDHISFELSLLEFTSLIRIDFMSFGGTLA